jgi:hypothetical protein
MSETFTRLRDGRVVWISTPGPTSKPKFGVFKDGAWTKDSWSMASLMEGTPLSKEAIADLKAKGMPDQKEYQDALDDSTSSANSKAK